MLVHSAAYLMIAYAILGGSQAAMAEEKVSTSIDHIAPVAVSLDVEGSEVVIDRPDKEVQLGASKNLVAGNASNVNQQVLKPEELKEVAVGQPLSTVAVDSKPEMQVLPARIDAEGSVLDDIPLKAAQIEDAPRLPQQPLRITKPPIKEEQSLIVEQNFSTWSDNFGNSGSQYIAPITSTLKRGNLDIGLRTAVIDSQFNGVLLLDGQRVGTRKGRITSFSDTSLSFSYSMPEPQFPVRFNMDFNLPTGRATLVGDEKNALMDGSLVQQTRHGEGFNVAPGVSVSHALSPQDVVGIGASYIIRGQFDPNGDVVNDEIKSGNEMVATLQYQHVEPKWLVSTGLIYTGYDTTQRGGRDYYRTGDRLDANVTGVVALSDTQRLQVAGRYFTQAPNSVSNFLTGDLAKESANSNGNALYVGADWGIATDSQQRGTFHILADYLTVQANSYDRINDLFNAGRDKFSLGIGYNYVIDRKTKAGIQVKYYQVTNKATPLTLQDISANGFNIFGSISHLF
jgi:hypothetical protein